MDTSTSTEQSANLDPTDAIANLLLGGDDEGAGEDPTNEQTSDTDASPDPDDVEDVSEGSTEESDEVDESDEEDDVGDDEEEDGEQDYQAVLADAFGLESNQVNVDEEGNVSVTVKVDGQTSTQTLQDLVKGYQTNKHNTNKSKALAEEKRNFDAYAQEQAAKLQQALEQNMALGEVMEKELSREFNEVDWDDLRRYDPAEWAAKRQEYSTRYQRIQNVKEQLIQERQQMQQQGFYESQQKRAEYVKGQFEVMMENNPAWGDKAVYKRDMDDMKSFLSDTYGFTDADFANVSDARAIELIKDAKLYHSGKKASGKKVAKVPKLQKSNTNAKVRRKKVSKLDQLTKAAKSAKGANKRSIQVDAVSQLLMGES